MMKALFILLLVVLLFMVGGFVGGMIAGGGDHDCFVWLGSTIGCIVSHVILSFVSSGMND
jgi:hypothetical protein